MKMSAIETTSLPPGATVQHYAVIDSIGIDAQYAVYRAECSRSLRSVVLYEYRPGRPGLRGEAGTRAARGRADSLERALSAQADRLRAACAAVHPALPVLEEIWQQDGTLYAVGPWQHGRCLLTAMTAGSSVVDPDTAFAWARMLGEALDALHRQGLVHGHVSPSTTRLLADGQLVLPPPGGPVLDEDAPAWVAPEQHPLNPRPAGIGPWTDVYQLSALLHHAMTGLPPPPVTRRWEGMPLERLSGATAPWPAALVDAVRQGLSMTPSARPRDIPAWLAKGDVPAWRPMQPADADGSGPADAPPAPDSLPPLTAALAEPVALDEAMSNDGLSRQAPAVELADAPVQGAARAEGDVPGPEAALAAADPAPPHDAGSPAQASHAAAGSLVPQEAAPDDADRPGPQDAGVVDVTAQAVTRRAPPATPAWVWVAAALSVAGVVGIVIAT